MILHRIVENNAPDKADMIGTKQWVFNNCLCGYQSAWWDSWSLGGKEIKKESHGIHNLVFSL